MQIESQIELQIELLGSPILRQVAAPVSLPLTAAQRQHYQQMLNTMLQAHGVGLAAPQVGLSERVCVIASSPNPRYPDAPKMEPLLIFNPEILSQSAEKVSDWEGCLSLPGLRGYISRHHRIRVRYSTITNDVVEADIDGFIARIFQHEIDHLNGLLFVDRCASTDLMAEAEFQRQILRQ